VQTFPNLLHLYTYEWVEYICMQMLKVLTFVPWIIRVGGSHSDIKNTSAYSNFIHIVTKRNTQTQKTRMSYYFWLYKKLNKCLASFLQSVFGFKLALVFRAGQIQNVVGYVDQKNSGARYWQRPRAVFWTDFRAYRKSWCLGEKLAPTSLPLKTALWEVP
jgi:hypothetical protein